MAWDEREQLKSYALQRQRDSTRIQLNGLDGSGGFGGPGRPGAYGDLKVTHDGLTKTGKAAFGLHNQLRDRARVAVPSSDSAAAGLPKRGFALGPELKHVSNRWEEQLKSLMDACAHVSDHMRVT